MPETLRGRQAPPRAGAMVEALRGLGYSTATALADIVDNSIAAGARQVDVLFDWRSRDSTVRVLDDGCGMDEVALYRAMLLGDRSPLDARATGDLGRFGLGLKTASFSQARRLTVASRTRGSPPVSMRWDLDVLTSQGGDGWLLLDGPAEGSGALLAPLEGAANGTLVVWEVLDRIVTPGYGEQDFLDLADRVERHLAMVYHRFLSPVRQLDLRLNGRAVRAWDPFLIQHAATWSSPVERIGTGAGAIEVQAHVLPHRDRLDDATHATAAGPDGWTAQQGFYVYRNRRLLVAGSWLGLGGGRSWTKEEAHRLARLRIDLPNTADVDWKIDIRKSVALPPVYLRGRLTRLAEDARDRARRTFAHRGQVVPTSGPRLVQQAWRADHFKGGMRYRIDRDHPAVRLALEQAGDQQVHLLAMLRVIEETIPVQRIWLDTAEARETPRTGFAGEPPAEVRAVLQVLYRNMVMRKGLSPAAARQRLLATDPFHQHPALVAALPDDPSHAGEA